MYTYYFYGEHLEKLNNLVVISKTITPGTRLKLERKGIKYTTCPELQPDWKTMVEPYKTGTLSVVDYKWRYSAQLDKLNPHILANNLGSDAVLLCYEPPTKFCHRHIVAEWLRSYGYDIQEYNPRQGLRKNLDTEWIL